MEAPPGQPLEAADRGLTLSPSTARLGGMPEEKALIDLTDEEIHAALRSEHHRNVVPSVAFLHEELNRRASVRAAKESARLSLWAIRIATVSVVVSALAVLYQVASR